MGNPVRDTLLLVASIVAEGESSAARFRVGLRNVGTVVGKVAWSRDNQHGISFDRDIDPHAVRAPVALADYLDETVKLRSGAAR